MDTYNFTPALKGNKWTDEDTKAHGILSKYADVGYDFWKELSNAKYDKTAGLSIGPKGMFIRDYKNYELSSGVLGCAVTIARIDVMINEFGVERFAQACEDITKERNLGLFVIIPDEVMDDGKAAKDWFVYQSKGNKSKLSGKYKSLIKLMVDWKKEGFELKNKKELKLASGHATYFNVGNTKASRKWFEARVKTHTF